ncbi:hypothetical protein ASPACDRAFT_1858696 [Aspergillus aculeatus ATCC 16872]|uniref:Uncharacterized protein n=1 Tax=Aspergillus aculeatus (strain ATCC 16872 / CBS 172.66 / WB 5094) TaxID=690307 RepID=A0A1L9WM41_ASPA1|nr:uncharacterized protein ASPACDRAFT_1858696 [Aspergillus aculeatus ATCC 16872]OJJ97242.1 hypothetical protein ASPACDRAFT_1858696 [Aspergillus aculeatus ATCC 16872]
MLSRAEFDLNLSVQSLTELLKHLERATEFKYERITDQGSRADIIVPEASEFIKHAWPRGATEMTVIDLSGDDDGPVRSIAGQLAKSTTDSHIHRRGTNDAVALATATIGVHMNQETGSEVAKSAADVVLMRPSLLSVLHDPYEWEGRAFVNARIPPEFAGLEELVSVLPVLGVAMLLRWARV